MVITISHTSFHYQRSEVLKLKKLKAMFIGCTLWVLIHLGNPGIFLTHHLMQLLRLCTKTPSTGS
nr:hypothetical protein Iba_chr15eCG1020 [Ipomoea batatas]